MDARRRLQQLKLDLSATARSSALSALCLPYETDDLCKHATILMHLRQKIVALIEPMKLNGCYNFDAFIR